MQFKKILVGTVCFLLVAVAFFFFKWEEAKDRLANDVLNVNLTALSTIPKKSSDPLNDLTERTKKATSPNSIPQPKPFAGSLPPANLPLIQIVDLLKAESAAGNYRASCRLGLELSRCEMIPLAIKMTADLQQSISTLKVGSENYLEATKKLALYKTQVAFDAPVCNGFTNPDKLEAWRFDFTAALQGHIASKAQFAIMPSLNPIEFYKNLDGWAAYREYAPTFLLEAANAGNNKARWSLARAYAGEQSLPGLGNLGGVELAKPDPYQAAVYGYTLFKYDNESEARNSAPRFLKEVERQLTPEKIAAAKAESMALRAKWATPAAVADENVDATKERRSFDSNCDEP